MSSVIEITGLSKRFGRRTALDGLDLHIPPGTIYGLIGPNGAGKTTTLRTLLDIIRPTSGRVRVLGEDPRHGGARLRRRIGYVPGELRLDGRVTGHRLLSFYAGVSGPVERGYPAELAERLGVDLTRPVRSLSKGNKQKVGLIQAFMHRPELLILDEPTSGLDPLVQREFLAMLREARDAGQTVLLSSHVLSEIQQAADDVAVLAAGRIVAAGDVASLRLGAVRHVRVSLDGPDPDAAQRRFASIPGVSGLEVTPLAGILQLSATVEGAIDPFVKALAEVTVHDLTIEEPDLEESVLRLYGPASLSPTPPDRADTPRYGRAQAGVSAGSRGIGAGGARRRGGAR
ncbi:ABC transporter ATP-binding protein [Microbacterium sp. USHLN186]|uniref:ABC transporter ATP-binding protein n=1 Tax=Microbacterium sp. USHLN186 TaxID=3081286 RepID=UPI00301B0BBF